MRREDALDPDIQQTFHDFDELIAGQPDGHEHCEEIIVKQKTIKMTKKKCVEDPELCYEEWQKAQRVPGRITSVTPRTNNHLSVELNKQLKTILKHDEYIGWLRGNIFASMKSSTPGDAIIFQEYFDEYIKENTP